MNLVYLNYFDIFKIIELGNGLQKSRNLQNNNNNGLNQEIFNKY